LAVPFTILPGLLFLDPIYILNLYTVFKRHTNV